MAASLDIEPDHHFTHSEKKREGEKLTGLQIFKKISIINKGNV